MTNEWGIADEVAPHEDTIRLAQSLAILHDGLFNEAEAIAGQIIASLSQQSDEQLMETRRRAKDLGAVAWRIECECDREVVRRGTARGEKKAVVEQAARESGVSPHLLYMNAHVADVVDSYTQSQDVLTLPTTVNIDKSFVIAALSADNPVQALADIVKNKESDCFYSVRDAKRDVAAMKIQRSIEPPLPDDKYSVVLADPPWQYDFSLSESREIENQYPTMPTDEIKALNVPGLCADDCVLFLWATSPKLVEAMEVMAAWGFRYVTNAVWDKEHIGMGYYFRQQHELLLVGKRGSLPAPSPPTRPSSVMRSARSRHSEKPEVLYCCLEAMYPRNNRVELFCRVPREGWSVWGNEV